jgi:hypothetical protein
MIEEKKAERIIDNIGKYLGLPAKLKGGIIYADCIKPFDARISKTIIRHYNVKSYIQTDNQMIKNFILVVF